VLNHSNADCQWTNVNLKTNSLHSCAFLSEMIQAEEVQLVLWHLKCYGALHLLNITCITSSCMFSSPSKRT